jgi:hypothetical protein
MRWRPFRNTATGDLGRGCLRRRSGSRARRRAPSLSLIVADANEGAMRLYLRSGYVEAGRRPLVPFPGLAHRGDWVLLTKPDRLNRHSAGLTRSRSARRLINWVLTTSTSTVIPNRSVQKPGLIRAKPPAIRSARCHISAGATK